MSASRVADALKRRHPLQRFNAPGKGISGATHNDSFGWHLQYLTMIGITTSTICFSIGLIADMTSSQQFFTLKNYLALVAAPIEILVSMLYWGLRAINRELVIPPDLPTPPIMADFGFHLFPTLLLSLDALFLSPPWPTSPINPRASTLSLLTSTVIAFLYWFWIELCYSYNGFYPYPIFAILNTAQRICLFALSGVAMWAAGAGLRWCYRIVNGIEGNPSIELGEEKKLK
ncbi:hypothetical protein P171DRAFT_457087 [Karstenula rhodostoma CBS 690.94]|uniref:Integral membrane protein n=1 Tax=Karstenula rhodostoma CBS 690.94 TaxID=1392251 RepID=A0A9P4PC72_9PLEO|nr:hypothetical protein P171DRAFT_457087 [Karstenula rhodostoma CBS 690.94]